MSGWHGSTRSSRLPADWPTIRQRVLTRDQHICHVCGRPGANDVDHLQPGDDHSDANLAAIHRWPCHARKSAGEGGTAAAQRRISQRRTPEKHPGLVR